MEESKPNIDSSNKDVKNDPNNKPRRYHGRFQILSGVISIIALGFIVTAITTGYLAIVIKNSDQKIVVLPQVCDYSIVKEYNSAMSLYIDADKSQQGLSDLKSLSNTINNKQAFGTDPTCLYIRYQIATINLDYSVAKASFDAYSRLVEQNKFADGRLQGLSGVDDMSLTVDYLASRESNDE